MCLLKKPKPRDYWSTSDVISTPFPGSVMSRSRFTAVLCSSHFNDCAMYIPRNGPGHDPVYKIRPFLEHLLTYFRKLFSPYENLIIDEGVCGFRERVVSRLYIKSKPDNYGIKKFTLCDSKTGYVLHA